MTRQRRQGDTEAVNRNVLFGESDLVASLDELQMLCPNLKHVALVVAWFGDDLRAGECRIRPAVTTSNGSGFSKPWVVSGVSRGSAMVVSTHDGGAAYGGTPSDRSVMDAIAEIKSRGLKVTLYPFVMMDVPEDNDLPDPYGNPSQPAYPWRGRITCEPAPLVSGTADRTAEAREQVEDFCGNALPGQFYASADTINFSGSGGDWGYRRFILHNARLAQAAGGVDAFLIGSELRGLTTLRDEDDEFPFVDALRSLAGDVRGILGSSTKITYGADWSEYFGYHPLDGTGDVYFHLDPLWARRGDRRGGHRQLHAAVRLARCRLCGGQSRRICGTVRCGGHAGGGRRRRGFRLVLSDIRGAALARPFADHGRRFRQTLGLPRQGPEELVVAAALQPDRRRGGRRADGVGAREQTVSSSPRSAARPPTRGRTSRTSSPIRSRPRAAFPISPAAGARTLRSNASSSTHHAHWNPDSDTFEETDNPVSTVYGGRMVDPERLYVWAWDARPYPAFPLRSDLWSDGGNWHYGHWLNGRIGNPSVGELINAILADHGLPPATVESVEGTVHGYVIDEPGSARSSLDPLIDLFGLAVIETAQGLVFRGETEQAATVQITEMVSDGRDAVMETVRSPDHQLPSEAVLSFRDPLVEYQTVSVNQTRSGAPGRSQHAIGFPGSLEAGQGRALIGNWLQARMGRARKHRVCRGAAQCRDRAGRHRSPA